jgi:putative ABC transport system permease protein
VVLTPDALKQFSRDPGLASVYALATVRPGADRDAVLARLDAQFPYAVSDESIPGAPGPIRNLSQIVRLPLMLALFFAVLGAAAIGQALFMTAAQRRGELAVLRALGFTRGQIGVVISSAATSFAVVALAIGIPLGLLAGRFGWKAVADTLYLAPSPQMPIIATLLVALGLLVFSAALAIVPARLSVRRSPGESLRTE